jgi:predicted membrane protein
MILGIFIVLVGISILVEETDILRYIFPVLLMVFGLVKIFGTRSSSSRILGTILVFLGFMFLVEAWSLWPILIILLGLNILWKGVGQKSVRRSAGRTMSGSGFVKDFVLFGGSERVVDSPAFEGGDVSAVFGGVELDLRRADIEPDREAVLDVFVLFGSTEITIPPSWEVSQEATAIFGAVEDQTRAAVSGPVAGERRRRLVIRGYALFGGIEIKN